MKTFKPIRIAYLDDLENDPEVQKAVSRGSWEMIKRKDSVKFENSMRADISRESVSSSGIFCENIAILKGIPNQNGRPLGNAILDLRPGYNSFLYPGDPDSIMFYNDGINYAFYYIDYDYGNEVVEVAKRVMDWISSNYSAGGERKLKDIGIE